MAKRAVGRLWRTRAAACRSEGWEEEASAAGEGAEARGAAAAGEALARVALIAGHMAVAAGGSRGGGEGEGGAADGGSWEALSAAEWRLEAALGDIAGNAGSRLWVCLEALELYAF